jgi:hypothetical protein
MVEDSALISGSVTSMSASRRCWVARISSELTVSALVLPNSRRVSVTKRFLAAIPVGTKDDFDHGSFGSTRIPRATP